MENYISVLVLNQKQCRFRKTVPFLDPSLHLQQIKLQIKFAFPKNKAMEKDDASRKSMQKFETVRCWLTLRELNKINNFSIVYFFPLSVELSHCGTKNSDG